MLYANTGSAESKSRVMTMYHQISTPKSVHRGTGSREFLEVNRTFFVSILRLQEDIRNATTDQSESNVFIIRMGILVSVSAKVTILVSLPGWQYQCQCQDGNISGSVSEKSKIRVKVPVNKVNI